MLRRYETFCTQRFVARLHVRALNVPVGGTSLVSKHPVGATVGAPVVVIDVARPAITVQ